ncbi:MAG: RES family NAD+ phosphorylase [Rhodospirillales bacterium]|nr:RES family NAD+ phosphorylase [Rhodospirillales bacterium]
MSGPAREPPPQPPPDLAARDPHLVRLAQGTVLHRFFTAGFDPVFFDRSRDGRLNAPDGSYGVLYAAQSESGAFAETFLRQPGRTLIPPDLLAGKAYVRLEVLRPLTLIKFSGPGLGRLGATAEVVHGGRPYATSQAWSRALHAHPRRADGIAYTARHDDEAVCFALFDGAPGPVAETGRDAALDAPWFWRLAEPYGVGLAPG